MAEKLTLRFDVKSFRKIPNPYLKLEEGNHEPNSFVAICDVKDLPDNIPMETNPREQNLKTNVAKKIKESLLDTATLNFYLLNRGMLISAKEVAFNNYSNQLTLTFEDFDVHGNVDGGHTYKTILEQRDNLENGQQFVRLEILTGVEEIFQSLARARNTSVPVKDKSIAELENRFDIIKNALINEPYMTRVYFKENDTGDIDVADMLSILMMFNLKRFPGVNKFPTISYSGKKSCIDGYLEEHKTNGESKDNPYVKMVPIMPDFFKLYDEIEINMSNFYKEKTSNGRYGSVKGVVVPKSGVFLKSKFYENRMDVQSPNGFLYPILGAFRSLIGENENGYFWKQDPFDVLKRIGPDLVESTVSMSRSLGNNPQSTGKDTNLWKTLYMTVAFAVMS